MYDLRGHLRGPFFDLRAKLALRRGIDEAKQEIADHGVTLIQDRLKAVVRKETPYYRTQIRKDKAGKNYMVHDSHVVYGPWLEGVSRRNQQTRFKGYHTFRIIKAQLQKEAPYIADRVILKYTRDMR